MTDKQPLHLSPAALRKAANTESETSLEPKGEKKSPWPKGVNSPGSIRRELNEGTPAHIGFDGH